MAKKKKVRKKKTAARKHVAKKRVAKKKAVRRRKPARRKKTGRAAPALELAAPVRKGLGPGAAGQSGDVEGLSETEEADSESVSELAEEGQDYEAEVVSGVENAPDADQGEVRTHEVPEDDVPGEYLEKD
ncbi:MAG: hypothetical protein WB780_09715 [Candidatus Acidiferrales bacterium]